MRVSPQEMSSADPASTYIKRKAVATPTMVDEVVGIALVVSLSSGMATSKRWKGDGSIPLSVIPNATHPDIYSATSNARAILHDILIYLCASFVIFSKDDLDHMFTAWC